MLHFTHNDFLLGVGYSWASICAISQVGLYFEKYRAMANGVAASGSAVCSTLIPYLSHYLADNFGWRGTLMIYAGFAFNISMLGALIRPIFVYKDDKVEENKTDVNHSTDYQAQFSFKKFLSKYWVFMLFAIPEIIEGLAGYVPIVYVVPYAKELGQSDSDAAQLLSMTAIADIVARPLGGILISMFKIIERNILIYLACTITLMSVLQLLPLFFKSYNALFIYAILFGGSFGLMVPGTLTSVPVLLGAKDLQKFMGMKFFVNGIATLVGAPIAGKNIILLWRFYFYCVKSKWRFPRSYSH